MNDLILVKLGGSVITEKTKPYTVREKVLDRLINEIAESETKELVVGHGGGSFPHTSAKKYQTHQGYLSDNSKRGYSLVENDAAKLNRIVVQKFLDAGVNAVSVQPSATCFSIDSKIRDWNLEPMEMMIKDGYLPVPYGDAILDKEQGCSIVSTEKILVYLAQKLDGKKIILVGKVDGVMVNNSLVKKITSDTFSGYKEHLGGSDGADVTGGMYHKIKEMLKLADLGIESQVINGEVPGRLEKALNGEDVLGTKIL